MHFVSGMNGDLSHPILYLSVSAWYKNHVQSHVVSFTFFPTGICVHSTYSVEKIVVVGNYVGFNISIETD